MKQFKLFFLLLITLLPIGGWALTTRSLHVATAGTLPNLISESEKYTIEELTLTGYLNGTDFRLLRDMAGCNYKGEETEGKLTVLDMSDAHIVAGGEKYVDTDRLPGGSFGTCSFTIDNNDELPQHVFHGCKFISFKSPNSVTSIGRAAFFICSSLTSVTIPNSVTSIGGYAFSGCSGLTSITIPNSVTSIGGYAFSGCSGLTSIEIPKSVTSIGGYAFWYCRGLTSVTIPNSVTSIGQAAFEGCSGLTSVIIPNSVMSIGDGAFFGCTGLTSITIPDSVTSIGIQTFSYCSCLSSVTIPNTVTSIGRDAFRGCNSLFSITIPNSVTSIGGGAFEHCSGLSSVTIPNSVTSIGDFAFSNCMNLVEVHVELLSPFEVRNVFYLISTEAVLYVPRGTKDKYQTLSGWSSHFKSIVEEDVQDDSKNIIFEDAEVKRICVSNWDINGDGELSEAEASYVTEFRFEFQNNTNIIEFDELKYFTGLTSVGNSVFAGCTNLESITIPRNVTSFGNGAFWRCRGLSSVKVDVNNLIFDSRNNCNAIIETGSNTLILGCKSTIIPNSITSIGIWAFSDCKGLTSINIPNSVVNINQEAFKGCTSLTSIVIPSSVTSIHYMTGFNTCTNLVTIRVDSSNPKYDSRDDCNAIIETKTNRLVSGISNSFIPNTVTIIGPHAFEDCRRTTISIPESVKTIEQNAFGGCNNLQAINIPYSVTAIQGNPLRQCGSLSSIVVDDRNTKFDSRNNCNAIIETATNCLISGCTNTVIPNSVTSIGRLAYDGCNSLKTVTIPNSVTNIGDYAFSDCKNLAQVHSQITPPFAIADYTFNGISSDAVLYVPQGTKETYQALSGWNSHFKEIVEEKAEPTLTILSTGSGYVTYNGTSVRSKTSSFSVTEGSSVTISFSPDSGYRIKSVKVNGSDVTSSVTSNQYTIGSIAANTTVSVEFEAIPPTTYTLNITASGNGSANYNGTSVRGKTSSFSVTEGSSVTVTFSPDSGYRIKSVKVNGSDVTASVTNSQYTIGNIAANTTVSVEFEAIPPTTYTLNITASGNGSASYNGTSVRSKTSSFSVTEGSSVTVTFSPDSGYRIKSVKVNSSDVTASVTNSQYTISSVAANTTVSVEFEAIPKTYYTLSITAKGGGTVNYGGTNVRQTTQTFSVERGTSATITFAPDTGFRIASVKVNGSSASVSNNSCTVRYITTDQTVEVTFDEEITSMIVDGVNYQVTSYEGRTVQVAKGDYGPVLTVPASFSYKNIAWTVTGIDESALEACDKLAAIVWKPSCTFTAVTANPNMLLYVTDAKYASSTTIKNVVADGKATAVTLADATMNNDFYCPEPFTANRISYTHHYGMTTGIGESRGWETICLPFDVQTVTHATKGTLVPFTRWEEGEAGLPFWLYELNGGRFVKARSIKANTPYIISMPNNGQYASEYRLEGDVTFAATSATVASSSSVKSASYADGRELMPCFERKAMGGGYYALNVSNSMVSNSSGAAEGSRFVQNLRDVLPFEACLVAKMAGARTWYGVFDDMTSGIQPIDNSPFATDSSPLKVYDLQGRRVDGRMMMESSVRKTKGVYIVNGKKKVVR